jgi:hypothetical protein
MKRDNQPPLAYEVSGSYMTRRRYRVLLGLTILNTVFLASYVLGPGLWQYGRQLWYAYSEHRASEAAARARAASLQPLPTFQRPEGVIAYDEDGAALLSQPGYTRGDVRWNGAARNEINLAEPFPQIAFLAVPPQLSILLSFHEDEGAHLLVHEMKTSSGEPRLVIVRVIGEQIVGSNGTQYELHHERYILADVYNMLTSGAGMTLWKQVKLEIPNPDPWYMVPRPLKGPFPPGEMTRVQFFTAKLDPSDPSHFTLPGTVNGTPVTLDAHLDADSFVAFKADQGKIVADSGWTTAAHLYTWTELPKIAATQSSTSPAKR